MENDHAVQALVNSGLKAFSMIQPSCAFRHIRMLRFITSLQFESEAAFALIISADIGESSQ
jgi:hypothetical protein